MYRDASTESHVPAVRLAVPRTALRAEASNNIDDTLLAEAAAAAVIGGGGSIDDGDLDGIGIDNVSSRDAYTYLRSAGRYYTEPAEPEERTDDFVVAEDMNLDEWIDEDDSEEVAELIARNHQLVKEQKQKLLRAQKEAAAGGSPGNKDAAAAAAAAGQSADGSPTAAATKAAAVQGKDFRVVFPSKPLGLTLTKNSANGSAEVTKVLPSGQADLLGVVAGDRLVGIGNLWYGLSVGACNDRFL